MFDPYATAENKRSSAAGISVGIVWSLVLILILSGFVCIRFRRRIKATEHDNREWHQE